MTDKPQLTNFSNNVTLDVQKYKRYLPSAFDESLSMLEKTNMVIDSQNNLLSVMNDVVQQVNDVQTWALGDGLTTDVDNKLDQMANDGTLENLIDTQILGDVTTLTTNDKSSIVAAVNEVNAKLIDMIVVESNGTDDTTALQNAIDQAKTVRLANESYYITADIPITKPVKIIGAFASESGYDTVIYKKNENLNGLILQARGIEIENVRMLSSNPSLETAGAGIVLGVTGTMAENAVLRNVMVEDCYDGVLLANANNCDIDVSVINNKNVGFNMVATSDNNTSGNHIKVRNAYGNNVGVDMTGEGNHFYIVSQSNTQDNIKTHGYCNNNFVHGYTENAVNGYEINCQGNSFGNTFMGTFRNPSSSKIYNSLTGFFNYLMFSWDVQNSSAGSNVNMVASKALFNELDFVSSTNAGLPASLGNLKVTNGELMYSAMTSGLTSKAQRELLFTQSGLNPTAGTAGNINMNNNFNNFSKSITVRKSGLIVGLEVEIDQAITADNLNFEVDVNGAYVNFTQFNSSSTSTTQFLALNKAVSDGDVVTIKVSWFNATLPANVNSNARIFIN